ncbi:MAG: hypothetical protein MUE72_01635 [Chitinophagaceae bacterium]|jgi:hypothetical protein|nr:hypothetical protein [Chitinophagaceae bacterium]
MNHTILVHQQPTEINIIPATETDIDNLVALNAKWQLAALNGNADKGFVGAAFNADFFAILITRNEVMVAYNESTLVAYILTVNHTQMGLLEVHQQQVQLLKNNGTIDSTANVAVGIQTAVEEDYHGTGLISILRNQFRDFVRDRYQYFFTTISKENLRSFASATKFGWQLVGSNEHYHYLILVV